MDFNFYIVFVSALVPLLVGMVWYSKIGFGNAWMQATGIKEEDAKTINMPLVFGLTYIFGLLLSMGLMSIVIHQFGVFSSMQGEKGIGVAGSEVQTYFLEFMSKYGHTFRTFKHGMLHGALSGLFISLPIVGIAALFERKSFKYIAIHVGFWIVCMMLMGGIICQWG